jgi:exodeoxyribonuclease VII large subunit
MTQPDSLFGGSAEEPVFSVSEFLDLANELLSQRDFTVQGEVTGAKNHPTGFYFSLRDPAGEALMECYMSPYAYRGSGVVLEDGMLVRAGGVASVYKKRGRFSFRVESLALAGEGSLKKAYEALKLKLAAEGLFDRKRPLPPFIRSVALLTSRTGAVIDDFRKNLAPLGLRVMHTDVRVEGVRAVGDVKGALEYWNRRADDVDALVLIRGGGSWEDLAAFNDEFVTRAVFSMKMPTLVSIGHDRDVPLAQLAADASASTPTATAHLVNQSWSPLTEDVPRLAQRLAYGYGAALVAARSDVRSIGERLATHLARVAGRGRELERRLVEGAGRVGERISRLTEQVNAYGYGLEARNPERLLKLGYSIVTNASGGVVRDAAQVKRGQSVHTRLARGAFSSEIKEVTSD